MRTFIHKDVIYRAQRVLTSAGTPAAISPAPRRGRLSRLCHSWGWGRGAGQSRCPPALIPPPPVPVSGARGKRRSPPPPPTRVRGSGEGAGERQEGARPRRRGCERAADRRPEGGRPPRPLAAGRGPAAAPRRPSPEAVPPCLSVRKRASLTDSL